MNPTSQTNKKIAFKIVKFSRLFNNAFFRHKKQILQKIDDYWASNSKNQVLSMDSENNPYVAVEETLKIK